jgi:hypothetical protein
VRRQPLASQEDGAVREVRRARRDAQRVLPQGRQGLAGLLLGLQRQFLVRAPRVNNQKRTNLKGVGTG